MLADSDSGLTDPELPTVLESKVDYEPMTVDGIEIRIDKHIVSIGFNSVW